MTSQNKGEQHDPFHHSGLHTHDLRRHPDTMVPAQVTGAYPAVPAVNGAGQHPTVPLDLEAPRPASHRRVARLAAAVLVAIALTVGGGAIGALLVHRSDAAVQVPTGAAAPAPLPVYAGSAPGVAQAVLPSVVHILVGEEEGSGVVLTASGAILTNHHVVADGGGNPITVTFNDGTTARATLTGTDPVGDVAVITIAGVSGLTPAKFGDSDAAHVGDTVLAIGSPLGLQSTVTEGIISALHRTADWASDNREYVTGDAIQTDAAVNPGNSGGALVNLAGEVIGINTAGYSVSRRNTGSIGISFAISSNVARSAAEQLLRGGTVAHADLGARIAPGTGGALLEDVPAGTPAAKAGLRPGDVVIKAGTKTITNDHDLIAAIQATTPGTTIDLTIRRNGLEQRITVTLTA